uniref:RING-type E3 ubiquitin transferase n=1 Tax=Arcella intermedia TaxID=1963864 RepID=A0A6B2KXE7_9EUKA
MEWEEALVCKVFGVSLKDEGKSEVIYLDKLRKEFELEGREIVNGLSILDVDRVLLHVCGLFKLPSPFLTILDYLRVSYKTAAQEKLQILNEYDKVNRVDEILDVIMNQMILLIKFPNMYPLTAQEDVYSKQIVPFLEGLCMEKEGEGVVKGLIGKVQGDEEVLEPILDELVTKVLTFIILDPFEPSFKLMKHFFSNPCVLNYVVQHPKWIPSMRNTGKELEATSILGPFFRLNTLPSTNIDAFFPDLVTPENKAAVVDNFRKRLEISKEYSVDLVTAVMESSVENGDRMLDWFGTAISRNKDRVKMNVDRITLCSDSFLANVTIVLLRLCQPFTQLSAQNVDSIDSDYLLVSDRLNIPTDTTRLNLLTETLKTLSTQLRADRNGSPFNRETEYFFLALQALHLGLCKMYAVYDRQLGDLRLFALREAQLLEPKLLEMVFTFYSFFSQYMVQTALGGRRKTPEVLPLVEPVPRNFSCIPEYFVEDLVDFFSFLVTRQSTMLDEYPLDSIFCFLTTFIASPDYIKNPHLRGKLIDLLGCFTPAILKRSLQKDPFCNTLAETFLPNALTEYYIDIEITGASNQFYDKFNGRFYVSVVLKHIWGLPSYRNAFEKIFHNEALFLRFTNMLMNDSIFLMDEAFGKIKKLHELEQKIINNNHLSFQEREEYNQHENLVRTYLLLGYETIRMLEYMTRDFPSCFIRPEMQDRLVGTLNYWLMTLVGPNSKYLAVTQHNRYHFQPDWLIEKIAHLYVNFLRFEEFFSSVVKDVRSYSGDVFKTSVERVEKALLNPKYEAERNRKDLLDLYKEFVLKVESKSKEEEAKQEILGEVPEEFLDPLLQTLMRDPVRLPTSNIVVDRNTIIRHLLSTPSDPFNRHPLTAEQLIPDNELKKKIEDWLSKVKS